MKEETIIRALTAYKSLMEGMVGVYHTAGDHDSATDCAIEARNAEEVLNEMSVTK